MLTTCHWHKPRKTNTNYLLKMDSILSSSNTLYLLDNLLLFLKLLIFLQGLKDIYKEAQLVTKKEKQSFIPIF